MIFFRFLTNGVKKMYKIIIFVFCFSNFVFAQNPFNSEETINSIIGDLSFQRKFGESPNFDSPEDLRIATHLNFVIDSLSRKEPISLKRQELLSHLKDYVNQGIFPRNYDLDKRNPCFIDSEGKICAVGYLVEKTVGREIAEQLNKKFKYSYIYEMESEILENWIKESGFTKREIAMIQPSYGPLYLSPPMKYKPGNALEIEKNRGYFLAQGQIYSPAKSVSFWYKHNENIEGQEATIFNLTYKDKESNENKLKIILFWEEEIQKVKFVLENSKEKVIVFYDRKIKIGEWYNFIGSINEEESDLEFYVNGLLANKKSIDLEDFFIDDKVKGENRYYLREENRKIATIKIGKTGDKNNWSGIIDEFSLWQKTLSPDTVNYLFNHGIESYYFDVLIYYNFNSCLKNKWVRNSAYFGAQKGIIAAHSGFHGELRNKAKLVKSEVPIILPEIDGGFTGEQLFDFCCEDFKYKAYLEESIWSTITHKKLNYLDYLPDEDLIVTWNSNYKIEFWESKTEQVVDEIDFSSLLEKTQPSLRVRNKVSLDLHKINKDKFLIATIWYDSTKFNVKKHLEVVYSVWQRGKNEPTKYLQLPDNFRFTRIGIVQNYFTLINNNYFALINRDDFLIFRISDWKLIKSFNTKNEIAIKKFVLSLKPNDEFKTIRNSIYNINTLNNFTSKINVKFEPNKKKKNIKIKIFDAITGEKKQVILFPFSQKVMRHWHNPQNNILYFTTWSQIDDTTGNYNHKYLNHFVGIDLNNADMLFQRIEEKGFAFTEPLSDFSKFVILVEDEIKIVDSFSGEIIHKSEIELFHNAKIFNDRFVVGTKESKIESPYRFSKVFLDLVIYDLKKSKITKTINQFYYKGNLSYNHFISNGIDKLEINCNNSVQILNLETLKFETKLSIDCE